MEFSQKHCGDAISEKPSVTVSSSRKISLTWMPSWITCWRNSWRISDLLSLDSPFFVKYSSACNHGLWFSLGEMTWVQFCSRISKASSLLSRGFWSAKTPKSAHYFHGHILPITWEPQLIELVKFESLSTNGINFEIRPVRMTFKCGKQNSKWHAKVCSPFRFL